ncbi:MAG: Do family serine endopeptidase, partial [Proteobacteria bacterium]|nr:Do family serine endopeptidase [Pseudomonadota bacterium]
APQHPQFPPGSPFEEFFKEFFDRNHPQQRSRKSTSLGSGFIIDSAGGYVVTNNHVIQDAEEITVILHDNTRLKAELVGRDLKTDLAVVKVKAEKKLPETKFGNSDMIDVGDWVIAIGNPFGLGGTVTAGIISARGRDIQAGPYDDFLQTDASINRGNSGGPMFNLDGEVIGINTAIFSPTGGSVGIGFAIPSNVASPVIAQLIKHGKVKRGWLGVHIQTVTDEIAESLGLGKTTGALVSSVIKDSPAEAAGFKSGDVVLQFNGRNIDEVRRLTRTVADTEPNQTVDAEVWRDGKKKTLKVKVGEIKEEAQKVASASAAKTPDADRAIDALGLRVASLNDKLREKFGLDAKSKGVIVTNVDGDGPAAEKGLKAGDRIIQVSQADVTNPADVERKVEEAKAQGRKSVLLRIEGEQGVRFVAIRIEKG